MSEHLERQLIRHEGLKLFPYQCPAGFLTIGVGRNLEGKGITKAEALFLLKNDIADARNDVDALVEQFRIRKYRQVHQWDLPSWVGCMECSSERL